MIYLYGPLYSLVTAGLGALLGLLHIPFDIAGIHPQDIAFVLNKENVAVRTGHHCAEPLVNRMGYTSLTRASLGLYSNKDDIDALVAALLKAEKFFRED